VGLLLQSISEEMSRLDAEQKDKEDMRRQIEECISYQQSLAVEKELQSRIDKVQFLLVNTMPW
jgi:hypothetical protein